MRGSVWLATLLLAACGSPGGGTADSQAIAADVQLVAGSGGSAADAQATAAGPGERLRVLEGTWLMHMKDARCDVYLALGSGHYGMDLICELSDRHFGFGGDPADFRAGVKPGGYGIEAEGGSYALSRGKITLVPEYSSCAWKQPRVETLPYEMLSSGSLQIATAEAVLVMGRMPDDAVAVDGSRTSFGCWFDRYFSPAELTQL